MEDSQSTLARRLRRLESIEAIKQLKHRYLRACDSKDPVGVKACYAKGRWSLYYFLINTRDNITTQLGGIYRDRYRLTDDRSLIADVKKRLGEKMLGRVYAVIAANASSATAQSSLQTLFMLIPQLNIGTMARRPNCVNFSTMEQYACLIHRPSWRRRLRDCRTRS